MSHDQTPPTWPPAGAQADFVWRDHARAEAKRLRREAIHRLFDHSGGWALRGAQNAGRWLSCVLDQWVLRCRERIFWESK